MKKTYAELLALYADYRIDSSYPGFYDDKRFLRAESVDPQFLETYARFVQCRPYDDDYLSRARREIPAIAEVVWRELVADGRLGACIDIDMILSRILEQEGFWNYMVKGSLTMRFPSDAKIGTRYYWSFDVVERPFAAAHAWIVAPPFSVVDVSIKQQSGPGGDWLPDKVVAEKFELAVASARDIFSPDFLRATGLSAERAMSDANPNLPAILKMFPPVVIMAGAMELKYTTVAISAPDHPFLEMANWRVNGRFGPQLYEELVKPHLQNLRTKI
jgi:hypothetical protein